MNVVFLKEEGYGTLAVFPDIVEDLKGNVRCYAHVGQHSTASPDYYQELELADDYQDLLEELESIGYDDLEVKNEVLK